MDTEDVNFPALLAENGKLDDNLEWSHCVYENSIIDFDELNDLDTREELSSDDETVAPGLPGVELDAGIKSLNSQFGEEFTTNTSVSMDELASMLQSTYFHMLDINEKINTVIDRIESLEKIVINIKDTIPLM